VYSTRGELVSAALAGRLDRRDLVRRATALGMSASVIAGLASLNSSRHAAAQSGPVTMVGWGYHPEIVEDNVFAFEEEYADDVEYQLTTGGNYHQIVETKFLGGEKPSVVYSESEYMYRWWRAGFTQDVEGLADNARSQFSIDRDDGAFVTEVVPGSAADDGGLRPGDVIIGIDGTDVSTSADVRSVVIDHEPGDEVEITFEREGEEQQVTVTLGQRGEI